MLKIITRPRLFIPHFKNQKFDVQAMNSFYSLETNLDFKHSSDEEMSLADEESKRFKNRDVQKVLLIETSKNGSHHRRRDV